MGERTDDAAAVRQRLLQVVGARPGPPAVPSGQSGRPAAAPNAEPADSVGISPLPDGIGGIGTAGTAGTGAGGQGAGGPGASIDGTATGADGAATGVDGTGAGVDGTAVRRLPVLGGSSPFDPGRRGVKALAAVALLVVLAAGFLAWRSRPHAEPVAPDLAASAVPAGPASAAPATTGAAEIVVAVAGKVRRPGLVRLPPGSRVADAVEAAGGVLPGTDLATVNLARKVADGELIVVGLPAPAGGGSAGAPGPAGAAEPAGGKVNLNTATLAQLDTLPGVGQVLAQRILDFRTSHGGFRSVSDLRQVDGIGDSRFEQLKELVTV